ncbi:hypothetical protein D3C72_1825590 [compost metagenome]
MMMPGFGRGDGVVPGGVLILAGTGRVRGAFAHDPDDGGHGQDHQQQDDQGRHHGDHLFRNAKGG